MFYRRESVRRYSVYAAPALWLLLSLISPGFPGTGLGKAVAMIVFAGASFGIHYLFIAGLKKPEEAKVD